MRWLIALALLPACKSLLGFDELAPATTDAPTDDGTSSDGADAPMEVCFGTLERVCLAVQPSTDVEIALDETMVITTTGGCIEPTSTTVPDACVIALGSFTTAGTLRVTGAKPLVLIVSGIFELQAGGRVDAASRSGGTGPGARDCSPATPPTGGGGGAGASLFAKGGNGGQGNNGLGGQAATGATIDGLVGGCTGSSGAGAAPGVGGAGGGGVLIIANTMFVDGTIDASGQGGGGGGGSASGGGGGGSGGMIVLDAAGIALNSRGTITAKGGGGGGGAGVDSADGQGGADGDPTNPDGAAQGGQGGEPGAGQGGSGGTLNTGNTGGGSGGRGGGGGGGATGVIRLVTPMLFNDGTVVPAAT